MKQFTAGKNEDGVRLSRFVLSVTQNLPNSLLYKSFRNKRIKVNGKKADADTRLQTGDIIELYINDEFFPAKQTTAPPKSAKQPPFSIVWQNQDIAIVYKPAGVLSHSDNTQDATLLSALQAHWQQSGEYTPDTENSFAPALCNRIDRGTEGLVVAAKSYAALRDMNELIRLGCLQKEYLCITSSPPPAGLHHAWLSRNKSTRIVNVTAQEAPNAKPITTEVSLIEQKGSFTLCRVILHTGRTHQIRAHLAFLGAPLLGDKKYGNLSLNKQFSFDTQALCAYNLTFAAELPPQSTLDYLAGKQFTANNTTLLLNWQAL